MNILHNNEILTLIVKDATDFFWFNPDIERYFYGYLGTVKIARFFLVKDNSWGYELEENTLIDIKHIDNNLHYFLLYASTIILYAISVLYFFSRQRLEFPAFSIR